MNYFTTTKNNALLIDIVLFAVRIFIGFAMLSHGFPKLQQLFSGEEIQFYNFLGIGAKATLTLAVFAEFVCSIFLILGFLTRIAVIFLIFTMAVAGFVVLGTESFEKKEISLLYLSIYLLIISLGAGRFSVDHLISKRRESRW